MNHPILIPSLCVVPSQRGKSQFKNQKEFIKQKLARFHVYFVLFVWGKLPM